MTAGAKERVVSLAVLGACIGSLLVGTIGDAYGRRTAIIVGDVLMAVGCILMYYSPTLLCLQIGRFVAGLGFGAEAFACNIYLAEVCPSSIRGAMIAANLACCVSGQLIALLVCIALAPDWRLMLGIAAVPAILQGLLMTFCMPETPYFLWRHDNQAEAMEVLKNSFSD